jgi:uncharacterized membrane protein
MAEHEESLSTPQQREVYERQHDPARVLALSDGVFAIVITLLVLEIHVPELASGQSLPHALREIRPSLVAFLISFVVVAISWAGHRDIFALIRRTDGPLVWLNVLYLLPLSILPFGAALLARYEREPVALQLYGIFLLLIAATRLSMWWYVARRPHLSVVPMSTRARRTGVAVVAGPGLAYLFAILVADAAPTLSLVIYATVPVLYFVLVIIARTTQPPDWATEREPG